MKLKPITREAIPAALEKAHRYRLLNQPVQAESICLDVLAVDEKNALALTTLFLALTDQFPRNLQPAFDRAARILPLFPDAYARTYYEGILCERRGKAHFRSGSPMAGTMAFEWLQRAMALYDKAEALRPPGRRRGAPLEQLRPDADGQRGHQAADRRALGVHARMRAGLIVPAVLLAALPPWRRTSRAERADRVAAAPRPRGAPSDRDPAGRARH